MDKAEFDKVLVSLSQEEKSYFHTWYVAYQDDVSWEQFKSKGYQHVVKVKKEVEAHVLKVTGRPKQLKLAFMPTDMTRTSPFFPMSRKEMKNRELYQDFVIENSWGRITFSGPQLSVSDETVLLALCFLAKKYKSDYFQTTYAELCRLMGVNRGKNTYKAIESTLKRLTRAVVDTDLYEPDNNKQEITRSISGAILSQADQQIKSSKIDITLSPYFLSLYAVNLTTSLNIDERAKLKGDTAKALYRFLQSHAPSSVPFGLMTLCHGINLNVKQPTFEIRKQIRAALKELCRQGHVKKGWKIDKSDNVHIPR